MALAYLPGVAQDAFSQPVYTRPTTYAWARKAWADQQRAHWLPEEVPMGDDVSDWQAVLTEPERNLLTQIFRFFTQADVDVHDCYATKYVAVFRPIEVRMMLSAFANMETIHIAAYAYLLDTLGMPESEYLAFMKYKAMREKHEYMHQFQVTTKFNIAKTLAAYGAFTEGLQLFGSFVILLNFPRFGKMKGMGQIVAWSMRDEILHTESIIRLFGVFAEENPEVLTDELEETIYQICYEMVALEDAFIDLAFELGGVKGLSADEVKMYIRYIANLRITQLSASSHGKRFKRLPYPKIIKNPLPWVNDAIYSAEYTNFFENKPTEYSKAATTGTWDDAFSETDAVY